MSRKSPDSGGSDRTLAISKAPPASSASTSTLTTPKDQLQQWFRYLQDFQVACGQVSAIASHETLLTFANDLIASDLTTNAQKAQFLIGAQAATHLTITTSDLAGCSSFEALLETVWNPLPMFVQGFIRDCAPFPYSAMSFTDFANQLLSAVFPGGTSNTAWINVQNGLTSSIPATCLTATQQAAIRKLVATQKKTIQDLVNLISTLG